MRQRSVLIHWSWLTDPRPQDYCLVSQFSVYKTSLIPLTLSLSKGERLMIRQARPEYGQRTHHDRLIMMPFSATSTKNDRPFTWRP
jgi:hypothetical protein